MKQLPNEKELQELVNMAKKFEQEIQKQCQIAGNIFDKYDNLIKENKKTTNKRKQIN
jgi:hypothetical protein